MKYRAEICSMQSVEVEFSDEDVDYESWTDPIAAKEDTAIQFSKYIPKDVWNEEFEVYLEVIDADTS